MELIGWRVDLSELSKEKVSNINSGSTAMSEDEIKKFLPNIPEWKLERQDGEPRLVKTYTFPNFSKALEFTERVGQAADAENHHPLISTEWGKVTVSWWTHKVHGLHLNDFVMAARTDQLYNP